MPRHGSGGRRPGFDPSLFHVRFVVDKVALGQYFSSNISVFSLCIIPSLHLHVALTTRTNFP